MIGVWTMPHYLILNDMISYFNDVKSYFSDVPFHTLIRRVSTALDHQHVFVLENGQVYNNFFYKDFT